MAKKEEVQEESVEPKKNKGLVIGLIALVVVLLIAIIVVVVIFMGSAKDEDESAHAEIYKPIDKSVSYSPTYRQFQPPIPGSPPQYFDMEQFVTNFKGEGKARHLAVKIKLMTYYPELLTVFGELKPMIVDKVLANLRRKTYTELSQDDAQEALSSEILQIIRAVLDEQKVYPETLDKVLVERFVMQ